MLEDSVDILGTKVDAWLSEMSIETRLLCACLPFGSTTEEHSTFPLASLPKDKFSRKG